MQHSAMVRTSVWRCWRGSILVIALVLVTLLLAASPIAYAQNADDEIVYIDPNGIVRVHDPTIAPGSFAIRWNSPRGGYTHLALIDTDRDGDMEIAVARPTDSGTIIDIYDPVITDDSFNSGEVIGGVPWRLVNSLTFEGQPALLAAGNLDSSVPGDELFFAEADKSNPVNQRFHMMRNVGGNGSRWESRTLGITSRNWNSVALGDMDGDTIDEIALASEESGTVELWQLGVGAGNLRRIYENPNLQRPWHAVAFGDWLGTGKLMLGAVRTAPPPFPSFVIFRLLDDGEIQDYHSENFTPAPNWLFFGDVNDSGDEEVYFLRTVPTTDTVRSRLFARNRGSDSTYLIEDRLDVDNGYRIGVAGDFDADGRAEVAVLRNNNLRIYSSPETNLAFTSVTISSNTRNVAAGDLDRNGHIHVVELEVSPATLTGSARSGEVGNTATIAVDNATNDTPLPFTFSVKESVNWLDISADSSVTPAEASVTFSAAQLAPGTYTATIIISSRSSVVQNQTIGVPVTLTVGNGFLAIPNAVTFYSDNCAAQTPMTAVIQLRAPANTAYTASLVAAANPAGESIATSDMTVPDVAWPSSVSWLSGSSPSGVAPESMTLEARFDEEPDLDVAQASVVIVATVEGRQIIRTLPVLRMCVSTQIHVPVVFR